MKEAIRTFPEKNSVSIRGVDWSLWIQKVKTRDNRVMFVLKPLKVQYSESNHEFKYEELKSPIWLNPSEWNKLVEALTELESSAKTSPGETGSHS